MEFFDAFFESYFLTLIAIIIFCLIGMGIIKILMLFCESKEEEQLKEYYEYKLTESDKDSMIFDLVFDHRMSFDDRCGEENICFRTKNEHDNEEDKQCEEYEQYLKKMSDDELKHIYRMYLIEKEIHNL